jgi:hypothetical protein
MNTFDSPFLRIKSDQLPPVKPAGALGARIPRFWPWILAGFYLISAPTWAKAQTGNQNPAPPAANASSGDSFINFDDPAPPPPPVTPDGIAPINLDTPLPPPPPPAESPTATEIGSPQPPSDSANDLPSELTLPDSSAPAPLGADPIAPPPALEGEFFPESTSPPGQNLPGSSEPMQTLPQDGNLDIRNIMIEEVPIFDRDRQALTFGFAYLQNAGTYFAAGGGRYGVTVLQRPLFADKDLQDSLVAEGGLYIYKALNFAANSDSFLVYSTIGTLRYNIQVSPDVGFFLYGGILKHLAYGTSLQSTQDAVAELSGIGIALGGGLLYRIGPNWHLRFDLGMDVGAAGLVLRF